MKRSLRFSKDEKTTQPEEQPFPYWKKKWMLRQLRILREGAYPGLSIYKCHHKYSHK